MSIFKKIKNKGLEVYEKVKNKILECLKIIANKFLVLIVVTLFMFIFLWALAYGMKGFSLPILIGMAFLTICVSLGEFSIKMKEIKNEKRFNLIGIYGFIPIVAIGYILLNTQKDFLEGVSNYLTFATIAIFLITNLIIKVVNKKEMNN